jgi:competence protein ComEC
VPLLAVAVLVLLLWNPWWAIEFGFILSVSATAGLLLFSLPLAIKLAQWMPYWCALAITVPLSAQLLCQPFIILLAPTLPTYGVLANIIAGPAAPLATILGLVACLIAIPLPWLAHVVMWCAWIPAQWIGSAAQSISHFPYPSIPWVSGVLGATIAATLSILFLVALLTKTTWLRTTSIFILLTSMLSWLCVVAVGSLRDSARIPDGWAIAVCDVGQGDAIFLASEKSIALIDTGPQPDRLERCLSRLGISHIDLLVLTHFDKDHVGGLEAVIGKVSHAIVGSPENLEDELLLEDLGSGGAELTKGEAGLHGALAAAKWQVLWPDAHHPQMQLGNPGSVTLMVSFPGFTSLFLGDHGKQSQLALMQTISLPHIDVVKVAHHGSADQSMTLYERIHPSVGLFSVGQENDYGHPRKEILDELHGLGALIPRTDEDGMIMVIPEPQGISVWKEH